jgi:N-acetyl-gamma-glutamyl-phosphate reductase
MIRVAVAGASGYTGGELLRFLCRHPEVKIVSVTSEQSAGKTVPALFPFLRGFVDLPLETLQPERIAERADVVFVALPHTKAAGAVAAFIKLGKKVVDLSADYRLHHAGEYSQWYGEAHPHPDLLNQAVYGLPEVHREEIRRAVLVANPGCYPTGSILGLAPFIREEIVDLQSIHIDAKSGLSGAGRGPTLTTHFPEANEGLEAYHIGSHRHTPEIEQEVSQLAGKPVRVLFVPHRVPMTRGILSTIYLRPRTEMTSRDFHDLARSYYEGAFFVRVLDQGVPNVRDVRGSNFCDIGIVWEERTGSLVVVTAIDNLGKGAAGQAVQNMNLIFGLDETSGLRQPGVFP